MNWQKKSKLELFSLTMNSDDSDKTVTELIKRLKEDICFPILDRNRWISKLEKAGKKEDEEEKQDAINRVLESIYNFADENRIWVS